MRSCPSRNKKILFSERTNTMKNIKKLVSVLMALTMVLAFAVTAYAAEPGSITVADPGNKTYTAYKIFDAEADANGNVSYSIAADSEWLEEVYDVDAGESKVVGLEFEADADPATKYTVIKRDSFSAANFAAQMKDAVSGKTPAADMDALDAGYYMVVPSEGAIASLTTVLDGQNVTIQNKNDMPFDKTVDGKKLEGVELGQVLNFKLEGKVPELTDETFYIYSVSDIMDEGITFNNDLVVKINNVEVNMEEITDAESVLTGDQIRFGKNGKTFELSLAILNRGKAADQDHPEYLGLGGAAIEITYTGTVNEDAISVISENQAVLTYGNNPDVLITKDSETRNYTARIIIDKFETGAREQKLAGAKFVLKDADGKYYKYTPAQAAVAQVGEEGQEGYVPAKPATPAKVEWVADQADATEVETDTNGKAEFIGLKDGNYKMTETAAPAGYTMLTDDIDITIDGEKATAVGLTAEQITEALTEISNINNTPGTMLPSTGGIGTTIFYMVGALLIVGAIVALAVTKRKPAEN